MAHPVVYPGDLNALIKKWKEEADKYQDKAMAPQIANGECARLPQELTSVGHTSRWKPGERVIDVARTLRPGTVIANFWCEYDKVWFPNTHGYHAALFVRGENYSMTTGKATRIIMFDQWKRRPPGTRPVQGYNYEWAKHYRVGPSDNANDFYVVLVP